MHCGEVGWLPISLMLAMITHFQLCHGQALYRSLPIADGVKYIGIGYNMIKGNPDGGEVANGGVDPGLLLSRPIFKFSYEDQQQTLDGRHKIPDEVIYNRRSSVATSSAETMIYSSESYTKELSAKVEVEGGYEGAVAEVSFAASARYQDLNSRTSDGGSVVLNKESITNGGEARYKTESAASRNYKLSEGFISVVCGLPADYSKDEYMRFMEVWGTHVVTKVVLGIREGESYEEKTSSFVDYAMQSGGASVSASGAYGGFSASVAVNMDVFSDSLTSESEFGKHFSSYHIGSEELYEPISLKVISMPDVFEPKYWTRLDEYIDQGTCREAFDIAKAQKNMETALKDYPEYEQVQAYEHLGVSAVQMPLTWPDGAYGLPKSTEGCPNTQFIWAEGSRTHRANKDGRKNDFNTITPYWAGWRKDDSTVKSEFCIKNDPIVDDTEARLKWQPGQYCILKYSVCPSGFEVGSITWDDADPDYSWGQISKVFSSKSGILPDGTYSNTQTKINFCCRNDGKVTDPLYLPTDDEFMLYSLSEECQRVHGMPVRKGWIFWDTHSGSKDDGLHPYRGLFKGTSGRLDGKSGVVVVYCLYYKGTYQARFVN